MALDAAYIIEGIRKGGEERRSCVQDLARSEKMKRDIVDYVKRNSGSEDDGLMVFHDSIVAFSKKAFVDASFEVKGGLEGYIYGIARYLWLGRLKEKKAIPTSLDQSDMPDLGTEDPSITNLYQGERREALRKVLDQLQSKCREVLMHWAGGYSFREIAERLGYASEGAARKKKYKCYKELSQWLESNPQVKEMLSNQ